MSSRRPIIKKFVSSRNPAVRVTLQLHRNITKFSELSSQFQGEKFNCENWTRILHSTSLFSLFFLSSFDKDQLANIHSHSWKERFKIRKLENFKGYTLKANEHSFSTKSRNFTDVCVVGGTNLLTPTLQKSVKFGDFVELFLRQFSTNRDQNWHL